MLRDGGRDREITVLRTRRFFAIICGLICAFWIFYEVRLLVVTHFLTLTRAGGRGAYLGAIVFPVIAILFGLGAVRLWKQPGPR